MSEVEIPYAHLDSMTVQAKRVIANTAHALFPGAAVSLVEDADSPLLSPVAINNYPRAELFVEAQMRRQFGLLPPVPEKTLWLDIETHNAEKRWDMPLEEFFRLGQYAWGEGDVVLTTELDEVLSQIALADVVVAHNGHGFDFSVLLGDKALNLAMERKLFDPYTYAEVKFPTPKEYRHANGTYYRNVTTPGQYRRWYGLDNLAYQFGAERKFGDLAALAAKYNPKGTPRSELDFGLIPVDDPDFLDYARQDIIALRELCRSMLTVGRIDDYDIRAQKTSAIYAQMTRNGVKVDVSLAQGRVDEAANIKEELLAQLERDYNFPTKGKMPWRSSEGKAAIESILRDAGIDIYAGSWPKTKTGNPSLGGDALIDGTRGTSAESLGESLALLQGQRPLAAQALTYTHMDGIMHPDIDPIQRSGRTSVSGAGLTTWGSRTAAGVREKEYFVARPGRVMVEMDLSSADARAVAFMSGDKNRAKWFEPGADSHEIVGRLMFGDEVYDSDPKGYRNISKACIAEGELVLTDQGLVPIEKITTHMLLWDGQDWVTHSGLIDQGIRKVMTYDGLTATPDHIVFLGDIAANDIAYLSYARAKGYRLTRTGAYGDHTTSDTLRWARVYDIKNAGPRHRFTVSGRLVHNCNHASAYGAGAKKLSMTAGVDYEVAERFLSVVQTHYPDVVRWQNKVRDEGQSGWLTNHWGRTMPVEADRAYTQAPALMGQSSTTEVLVDGLLRLYKTKPRYLKYVLFPIHDAILCEPPEDEADEFVKTMLDCVRQEINGIEFLMDAGHPAKNWAEAMHG